MLLKRAPIRLLQAPFKKHHYIALYNIFLHPNPMNNLWRYITARGEYPYTLVLNTNTGRVSVTVYSYDDMQTINEIFFRQDYYAHKQINTIVDIGSNIGISALYFLSRNEYSKCYLYEPDPKNILRLKKNLKGFEDRFILSQKAVSDKEGIFDFGVEETGRLGGIGVATGDYIKVECIGINNVLRTVLKDADSISILKVDTEGLEEKTITAIDDDLSSKVRVIYLDAEPIYKLIDTFDQNLFRGGVRMVNKDN